MTTLQPPTVVHVRDGYDCYIGRAMPRQRLKASDWANPYKIQIGQDRSRVLLFYKFYVQDRPDLLARLGELSGQRLGCWCHPQPCHGDTLVRLWWQHIGIPAGLIPPDVEAR